MGLRERNRRAAMRDVQRAALPLFAERGFESVTVDEIAEIVGMAPSTIFRHFGTKEAIVLWDEHDAAIDEDLGRRLGKQPPLEAVRDAFIETLGSRYDDDLEFQLQRIRFIYATEAVHAAAVEDTFADRDELSEAFRSLLPKPQRRAAPLLAGAVMVALDVAIERWQASSPTMPLARAIEDAFTDLVGLADLG